MRRTMRLTWCGALLVGAAMVGCKDSQPTASNAGGTDAAGTAEAVDAAFLLAEAPGQPVDVTTAKAEVAEGESIVLRGRIGGRAEPFTPGRATFLIVDASVPSCADQEGDACAKPWDYCCEDPSALAAKMATVNVVGEDGQPLAIDVDAVAGIDPLAEVIVVGTVGPRPTPEVLVVNATGVHVVGG